MTLTYQNTQMNPEPLNDRLIDVAQRLRQGLSTIVELEPGDATYYNLLIVPAWSEHVRGHLGRFGIPVKTAPDYLIVTVLFDTGGITFYATRDTGTWDLDSIPNEWTRELLVWWLRQLWAQL